MTSNRTPIHRKVFKPAANSWRSFCIAIVIMFVGKLSSGLFQKHFGNIQLSAVFGTAVIMLGIYYLSAKCGWSNVISTFKLKRPKSLGKALGVVGVSTIILILGAFFLSRCILPLQGDSGDSQFQSEGVLVFHLIVIAPFYEEFLFRGAIYQSLKSYYSVWVSICLGGIIFAFFHSASWPSFCYSFFSACILCIGIEVTGSLYVAIAVHSLSNAVHMVLDKYKILWA